MKIWSSVTIGCRANQSDTMEIEKMLAGRGWKKVKWGNPCDVALVNTCTVTARSDRQCRKTINKAARCNPSGVVVVTGCFAGMRGRYEGCPENVYMVAAHETVACARKIFRIVENHEVDPLSYQQVDSKRPDSRILSIRSGLSRPPFKVQDGCANSCAFCTVCLARGEQRSRPVEDIMNGLREFGESGVNEVVLTGINLGSWGEDLGIRPGISGLLSSIVPNLPVERIRLSSVEPQYLDEDLLALMKKWPDRICPHLHLPLQSADDHILCRMKRSYTFSEYAGFVNLAIREIKDICIGADVICGFPGETEHHFKNGFERIKALPISYLHVFPFSSRPGTAAASMNGKPTQQEIFSRSGEMRELAAEKKRIFQESQKGKTRSALVEHRRCGKTGSLVTTTDNYLGVRIPGKDDLMGALVRVKIETVGETISGCRVEPDPESLVSI